MNKRHADQSAESATGHRVEHKQADLPGDLRRGMEALFGVDLGAVRVHKDSAAPAANGQLNARAYTTGNDIFLAPGAYSPAGSSPNGCLAHELAHVVQQRAGRQKPVVPVGLGADNPADGQRLDVRARLMGAKAASE